MRLLGAIAWLSLTAQTAFAVTLTFDSQTPATGVVGLNEHGFDVTGTGVRHYVSSGGSAFCAPACANNGSNHLLAFDAAFEITPVSGNPFSILQLDIAESHRDMQQYWAQAVRVTGTLVDNSTVSVDLLLDFVNDGDGPLDDFQTELLSAAFSNLTSVRVEGIDGYSRSGFSVDNIVLNEEPTVPPAAESATRLPRSVPEPSTMALVAFSFAGLALAGRRRSGRGMSA